MLALSGTLVTILGSLGGLAALIGAIGGILAYISQSRSANNTRNIDLLHVGQESLKEALLRADAENKELRARLDEQEDTIYTQQQEITRLHRHVDIIERELNKLRAEAARLSKGTPNEHQ